MDSSTPTTPENDDYSPPMLPEEQEDTSSGNGRLALIAGGIVAAVLAGYLLLPAATIQSNSRPDLPAPTMELGEASITATRPTDETAAPAAATAPAAAALANTAKLASTAARPAAPVRGAAAPEADAPEADAPDLAPVVPAAAVAVVQPIDLAPTTLNMSGRVLDENGRPLPGATVMLRGSKAATSTDANGNYSLEVPAGADNTLLYGYGGYEDQLLRSRNTKTQNVTLVPKESAKRRKR